MKAAGSPANMLHSRGQEQLSRPHCSMGRKSLLKVFQSGLRTSRLGAGHNGSTARFMQGLAACLGKSKQESCLHGNPNGKACPPLALLPPCARCSRLSTAAWHCSALSSAGQAGLIPGNGWRGSSPLLLLTRCSCPGIGEQGKQVGPCPPLKNLMLVLHSPAIPRSLKPVRTCTRVVESG